MMPPEVQLLPRKTEATEAPVTTKVYARAFDCVTGGCVDEHYGFQDGDRLFDVTDETPTGSAGTINGHPMKWTVCEVTVTPWEDLEPVPHPKDSY